MKERVFVGVSGGVDSSVSLLRLKQQGYDVSAVFIKTWQPDFIRCDWEKERLDAMRVSAHIGVPFYTFNAEHAYKQEVADYMIREYSMGRTPNPDVMCNQFVKFGAFLNYALKQGAVKIATGHYAQCIFRDGYYELHRGIDPEKDQSYFLWTLTQEQLSHTLFPIGDSVKSAVRKEAEQNGLPTYKKHDSQGICFLGPVDMQEFLSHYIQTEKGDVCDEQGNCIGSHNGALMYTYGQRHGFVISPTHESMQPYYVIGKDLVQNTLTVSHTQRMCAGNTIVLSSVHVLTQTLPKNCEAQFRYRQKTFRVSITEIDTEHAMLTVLDSHIELPSLGQSCVFYEGTRCLGGGIINEIV